MNLHVIEDVSIAKLRASVRTAKWLASGLFSVCFAVSAQAASVGAVADAFVRDGSYAATNYGGASVLEVKTEVPSYNRDAYLKFPVSGATKFSSAVLVVYGTLDTANVSVEAGIYGVSSSSWSESGLTWNNKPVRGSTPIAKLIVSGSSTTPAKYEVDLTSYVNAEVAAGKSQITVAIHNLASSNNRLFVRSREDSAYKPVLNLATSSVSPQGTVLPPAAQLVDSNNVVWKLVNGQVSKNGVIDTSTANANLMLYYNSKIYHRNTSSLWFGWTGTTWVKEAGDPRVSSGPVATATPTPTPAPPASEPVPSGPGYYVSTSGSDSNSGTQAAPFRTIAKAAAVVKPGYNVYVAPGVYAETVYSRVHGTSSARIRFVSTMKYGAKLRPSGASGAIWRNSGNYTDIQGFEIDGTNSPNARQGIYLHGSYVSAKGNYIHHIHYSSGCTSQGAGGIIGEGYYKDISVDVIGNLIHHVGPPGCTYDHGIYHTGEGQITNNVVYKASGAALHLWHDPRKINMSNNTVSDSNFGIVFGGGDPYGTTNTPGDYITIANNIIMRCKTGVWSGGTLGNNNKIVNNLMYGNNTDFSLSKGSPTGTINADPLFSNYITGGGGDYRLRATSPAINKGSSTYAPVTDHDGSGRVGAPDIGAFEFK